VLRETLLGIVGWLIVASIIAVAALLLFGRSVVPNGPVVPLAT
jgi:hypothetical protein